MEFWSEDQNLFGFGRIHVPELGFCDIYVLCARIQTFFGAVGVTRLVLYSGIRIWDFGAKSCLDPVAKSGFLQYP